MKRLALLSAVLLMTAVSERMCSPVRADEGMWTLFDLPQAIYDKMVEEGCSMHCDDLYESDSALMKAVVNFSGYCTGVVVSPDGLVFTNHHCGFSAINKHSTPEHDYMLNGFFAKTREDELPNEDMFVSFMIKQEDVTDRVITDGFENLSKDDKNTVIDSLERIMDKEVKKIDSTYHAELQPFYEGNKYYLTTYQDFRDLRLVFAPTKSMGKFGGDTDNWMWPRQTCDFSVFRIYADPKTNRPAAYSKDNVPYHPQRWAKIAKDGYKPGDFAMIMGYPGSTERYLSSYGIQLMRDADNAPRVQVRGIKLDVMGKHMKQSEDIRIKYETDYAHCSNYWKNSMGMNRCIDSLKLIPQKRAYEAKVQHFVDSTGYMKDKLDLAKLKDLYERYTEIARASRYWRETFRGECLLTNRAMDVNGALPLNGTGSLKRKYYVFPDNTKYYDEATDKDLFVSLIKNFEQQVDKKYQPDFYDIIHGRFHNDYQYYADYLYANSEIMVPNAKLRIYSKKFQKSAVYRLGESLQRTYTEICAKRDSLKDSIALQEQYLCAAILAMEQDEPHYSDANFTMRLTYGQVGGFTMGGKESGYYTTSESLVEKMKKGKEIEDYAAEDTLINLVESGDFGKYRDKGTGKMQLCFLTNNDITGGNSGSPVFNGKGELLGLAFDGNWEALSSDIYFERNLARTISVDIRFVMWMIEKWGGANRLIQEIK